MAQLQTFLTNILTIMQALGGAMAAVAIAGGGLRYMFSEGNVNRAEQAKFAIIAALVGLGILLLASAISSLVTSAI